MQLRLQPNNWSCLPASIATCIDKEVNEVIKLIGHDGSEIMWPENEEPLNRRGFCVEEIVDVLFLIGYTPTWIDFDPMMMEQVNFQIKELPTILTKKARVAFYLRYPGVLFGRKGEVYHCTAWDGRKVLDPCGDVYNINDFKLEAMLLI
jgi:hypothetical protein